ncbi:MAG: NAD-dependent epimerase/dehydratase family protein [Bacteroidia bacterium]
MSTTSLRHLVIGAQGQIGQELVEALIRRYGPQQVIATDIRQAAYTLACDFAILDVTDKDALFKIIEEKEVDVIYNLAAVLSAKGEQNPMWAWELNMTALLNTLEATRHTRLQRLFWPSSIAVFGPNSPQINTPQQTIMDPNTVYGISKLAGERWCDYYKEKYGSDIRSLRYPGLIGYKSAPGGGTTDYAVDIFHQALKLGHYICFLREDSRLPMMYMPDAIRATLDLVAADKELIKTPGSYNLAGMSFTPVEIAEAITKYLPDFSCEYQPDFRQAIADSWPQSIDDQAAQDDWAWENTYDLDTMVEDMLAHLRIAV